MTTPPEGTSTEEPGAAPGPGHGPDHGTGPRVSGEDMLDLGRIRRSAADRHIAGVAGGIARHLDIDPLVVRVLLVVLAFFGGGGVLLYVACWLVVPDERTGRATIPLDRRSRGVVLWVVASLSAAATVGNTIGRWHFPWPLAIAGLVVAVLASRQGRDQWTPPPVPSQAAAGDGEDPTGAWTATVSPPTAPTYAGYRAEPPPDPRRRGPILFGFTLALCALLIGALVTLHLAGVDVPASAYPATVVGVCGLMLLISAWYGRGGGLILVGLVATVAMVITSTVGDWSAGRLSEHPTTAADVTDHLVIGAGEIRLDLTDLDDLAALDGRTLHLDGRFGHILVIVPDHGLDVDVDATIDAGGETELFGETHHGSGTGRYNGGEDVPTITLDAELVFGQIEVVTEAGR